MHSMQCYCWACSSGGARKGAARVLAVKTEGRRSLGRPWQIGRIILKWILKK